ncbi:flavin-dependent oxidoreductase [Algirhabdus cladophorae]|uniref:flavin-dependent oxidoreductase n=1 Tax=Algirhabdus cladophorae TaxID=3377108 RepID=UPI003B84A99E
MTVLIAGAGIAGLTLGLTLHQIGVSFRIFERVRQMQPLGVGINLQPTAVRELTALGLAPMLDEIGVATQTYGFYTRTGIEVWSEPRGLAAGYNWPQYSVHRGHLQMRLFDELISRAGPESVLLDYPAGAYKNTRSGVTLHFENGQDPVHGTALIGADGVHSAIRHQMYPTEGPPKWSGAILWRGTSLAKPFLTDASMILAGNDTIRIVAYPISKPDPITGLATINWLAEKTVDPATQRAKNDWNRQVATSMFAHHFADWTFDWLDVPALIRAADAVYEYPMIDRDPVDSWTDGAVTLIGDAAHATYPVGSSGASQAILDARVLGAKLLDSGVTPDALESYDAQIRPIANAVTLANRGNGPDAIMQLAEDRCNGDFSKLDAALPMPERAQHAAHYKSIAGLAPDQINQAAPILPPSFL